MSIQPPQGTLTIPNATLRVGRLQVDEVAGFDSVLNTIERNTILLDEPAEISGSTQWGLKVPNIFVATFEIKGVGSSFNFMNTEGGEANAGYTLEFSETTLTLKYNDASLTTATIPDLDAIYGKVYLTYEKQYFTVTINGTRVLAYEDTSTLTRPGELEGEFVKFFTGAGGGFKNLKVVAGHLISDGTSNVSLYGGLAVTSNLEVGQANLFVDTLNTRVGVGTTEPDASLHVTGNAYITSNLEVGQANLFVDTLNTRVGVGTTEPKESLDVVGNMHLTRVSNVSQVSVDSNVVTEYTGPHDRPLRKYPEVAMTANDNSSTSGYVVDKSEESSNGDAYAAYRAFDGVIPDGTTTIGWRTDNGYDPDTGLADLGVTRFTGDSGEWVELQLPNSIKLSRIVLKVGNDGDNLALSQRRFPKVFVIYGYNGTSWDRIQEYTTSAIQSLTDVQTFHISNPTVYHNKFVLVVKQTYSVTGATSGVTNIGELEYYGYEEGSGSLDTTLKSVYNVPATTGTQLEVYYDAKDYTQASDFAGTGGVVDKAGGDQDGTAGTGVSFDSTYNAFVFDASGSGNVTTSKITSSTLPSTFIDDAPHSVAMWFKLDTISGQRTLFTIKDDTSGVENQVPHAVIQDGILRYDFWSNNIQLLDQIIENEWYHLVITFSGGNHQSGTKFYINGVHKTNVSTPSATNNLDIQVNSVVYVGGSISSYERGINGSIANFRLYSKALNADQVKELYDYQKDYFLGSKSQVTLYKGHLGVGVTEPSGQLELAGDERIQEYPPRGLVGDPLVFDPAGNAYDYNVEGHGVFKVSSSVLYHASTSDDRRIYRFFDHNDSTFTHWSSFNGSSPYEATTNAQITTLDGGGTVTAHFAEIQMPYKITLKKYNLRSSSQLPRALKTGMILGSNDGNVYHVLHNVPDFGFTETFQTKEYTVDNATTPYRIFRLLLMNTVGNATCNMNEWRLFGTPGPTTLDKGSLSLTRSLDVPRISRYDVDTETPRPEKLVVDFDTTVNSSPTDISGEGNHGVFRGTAQYSPADKAFRFDGDGATYIYKSGASGFPSGDAIYSIVGWVNVEPSITNFGQLLTFGSNWGVRTIGALAINTSYGFQASIGGDAVKSPDGVITPNTWHHIAAVKVATGVCTVDTYDLYLDGVLITNKTYSGSNLTQNIGTGTKYLAVGGGFTGAVTDAFDGLISNPKLYNVALEPSEVKKLYNLGRTGRSMVISDTAVGIGKVPEAQLDVRGVANFGSRVGIGTTNPGYPLDVVGDIYATGNITGYSDRRAKSDIEKIENALEKIEQLNGYTFTMKGKRYTGLIAQEILPILPEAVTGSEETNYAVAYGNMMGLIVEAIKELKQKIG